MCALKAHSPIFGTTLFDGMQARRGYALNKMCFSFNDAANRAAFLLNETAYCERYGLNAEQRAAVAARAALPGAVRKVHGNYHIPISNTAGGLLALETMH